MIDDTKCPVCHMDVDKASAPSYTYKDEQHFFCSDGCREKFIQDPAAYGR